MENQITDLIGATDILTTIFESVERASEAIGNDHVRLNLTVTQFDALNHAVALVAERARAVDTAHEVMPEAA